MLLIINFIKRHVATIKIQIITYVKCISFFLTIVGLTEPYMVTRNQWSLILRQQAEGGC